MAKKCDIKGCKEKATVFTKTFAFCEKHYQALYGDVGCDYCSKE